MIPLYRGEHGHSSGLMEGKEMISRTGGGFTGKRKRMAVAALAAALTLAGTVQMAGASLSPTTLYPSSPVLTFSTSSDRSNLADLSGATLSGNTYIVLLPNTSNISSVTFRLDDPLRVKTPVRVEIDDPYDFAGGSETVANAFDTRRLTNGSHNVLAEVRYSTGSVKHVYASFAVRNAITSTTSSTVFKPLPTTTTTTTAVKPVPQRTQTANWTDLDDDWQTAR